MIWSYSVSSVRITVSLSEKRLSGGSFQKFIEFQWQSKTISPVSPSALGYV